MLDPLGRLIVEIRAYPAVAAITDRVRGAEPRGAFAGDAGDARGPGDYIPFIVLSRLGTARVRGRAPVQAVRIGFKTYAATPQAAAALYGALSDAVHNVGPRIGAGGVLIHRSYDDVGGSAQRDPDTHQPYEDGVISLYAAI